MQIDLNVDCGESYGQWMLGNDAEMLRHVSSASIACGGHAGDPITMRNTVRLCKELKVHIGAHPGYPDMQGFGRRVLHMRPEEISALIIAQSGALMAIAKSEGMHVHYIKPHGALFSVASADIAIARAIASAVTALDKHLMLYALAGSELERAGHDAGLKVIAEAYGDRAYEPDGRLRPRSEPNSIVEDNMACLQQIIHAVKDGYVVAHDGTRHAVKAQSVCIHGDTPGAPARAAFVKLGLKAADITLHAPR
jgi:UPF0271 protein